MLPKTTTYAIQALAYVAINTKDTEYVPIGRMANDLGIPYHFLKRIVAKLATEGMLRSFRSSTGGVALGKDASRITLFDVIATMDDTKMFTECIFGLPGCGEEQPCPMHAAWSVERNRLRQMFESTTVADLAGRVSRDGFRISFS